MDFITARRNMIDGQIRPNRVSDSLVIDAMENVPRERFVPAALQNISYTDEDISLGRGRWLIEPSVLARVLQAATIADTDSVLVVAGSTGYTAAVAAELAGSVTVLESDAAFAAEATATLASLSLATVSVVNGSVTEGYAPKAPYNLILIDGAVEHVPDALFAQLAEGGRLVAVVHTSGQGVATVFQKHGGSIGRTPVFDANVPVLAEFRAPVAFVF